MQLLFLRELVKWKAIQEREQLTKLQITLPFLEVVKIPQQKDNLLKVLGNEDKHDTRVEACFMNIEH